MKNTMKYTYRKKINNNLINRNVDNQLFQLCCGKYPTKNHRHACHISHAEQKHHAKRGIIKAV